ncbi:MAG: hypothetical protein ABSC22_02215, partial [Roseiarcus sp.]
MALIPLRNQAKSAPQFHEKRVRAPFGRLSGGPHAMRFDSLNQIKPDSGVPSRFTQLEERLI